MLVVLHANWQNGSVHVWGESAERFVLIPGHDPDAPADGSTACAVADASAGRHRVTAKPRATGARRGECGARATIMWHVALRRRAELSQQVCVRS